MQVQALGPWETAALHPSILHQGSAEDTQQ